MQSEPRTKLQTTSVVIQVLLLLAFGSVGGQKLTMAIADLAPRMSFVLHVPEWLVHVIGAAEVAGAVGLLLPLVVRSMRWLAPLASGGLLAIMLLAVLFHLSRGEVGQAIPALVLGALSAFVLWRRTRGASAGRRSDAEPLTDPAVR